MKREDINYCMSSFQLYDDEGAAFFFLSSHDSVGR